MRLERGAEHLQSYLLLLPFESADGVHRRCAPWLAASRDQKRRSFHGPPLIRKLRPVFAFHPRTDIRDTADRHQAGTDGD